ncbi:MULTISPECIES: LacI family DNA-binding transcriptional regulator [Arthrobacter]|uniref:LacI family DNA-binding transcriptional regulator n=2 Tax=Arthrobacter TaxID=1663 RepID=A0ABU9KNA6_9MICC|nr:LacI family DNA-binding transcriptional regulator [Arthrobacter sp. YJM1]MDP5228304.1 LacI family DNA-binding transcriptional regulator [Arthrobacter sp. YJM1]
MSESTASGTTTGEATARPAVRPTIRMVAELAGVSTATVSYVLSGRGTGGKGPGVKEETTQRVRDAAEQLGYRPNQAARAVRTGKTQTVLLSMTMLRDPWSLEVVEAVSAAARRHDLTPLIMADDDWNVALERNQADAVFIDAVRPEQRDALSRLAGRGAKLVVFDSTVEPDGFDVVRSDDLGGCRELVEHLLDGWDDVACLGPGASRTDRGRAAAFHAALAARGTAAAANRVADIEGTPESAYAGALALLGQADRPRAVYATSDYIAISAVHAAQSLGLEVGRDVAIAGVGNTLAGERLQPPLTSAGPTNVLGAIAELMVDIATDQRAVGHLHDFPWKVWERASTGHAAPLSAQ